MADDNDIPGIRVLVNSAYRELADSGLNYTATYQDESITRDRIAKGRAFLIEFHERVIGTVLLTRKKNVSAPDSAYISQLAVLPLMKKKGIGTILMDFCEDLARKEGFSTIQLDTAQPATHLVTWYLKRGYRIVEESRWEGKTYSSFIFAKDL